MKNPKISVIVPVYKVEKYLDKCIESIVNQTYQNLEILLVDDGSPDNCPQMCDKWAQRDSRIRVIHQKNGGVSASRNAGLDAATGDYIGFVDSDDWIDSDMYELLVSNLIHNNCDVSRCGFCYYMQNDNSFISENYNTDIEILNNDALMRSLQNSGYLDGVIWNKIYSNKLLNKIRFNENYPVGEDLLFNYYALKNCKKCVCNDLPKYKYRLYSGQAKQNYNFFMYLVLKEILSQQEKDKLPYMGWLNRFTAISFMAVHTAIKNHNKDQFKQIRKDILKYKNIIFSDKEIALRNKLKTFVICFFPTVYKLIS